MEQEAKIIISGDASGLEAALDDAAEATKKASTKIRDEFGRFVKMPPIEGPKVSIPPIDPIKVPDVALPAIPPIKIPPIDMVEFNKLNQALQNAREQFAANSAEILKISERERDLKIKYFGESSKEAASAEQVVLAAKKQAADQAAQLQLINLQRQDEAALAAIEVERAAAQLEVSLKKASLEQLLKQEIEFEDRRYAIKKESIGRTQVDESKDPVRYAQINSKLEALETQHQASITQIRNKIAIESKGALVAVKESGFSLLPTISSVKEEMRSMGMSAYYADQSMMYMPHHLRSIGEQLMTGAPLQMIAAQHYAQLTNEFGNMTTAGKAITAYLGQMINPLALSAAAVVGLSYAVYQGVSAEEELQKRLILTGNAMGLTKDGIEALTSSAESSTSATRVKIMQAIGDFAEGGHMSEEALSKAVNAAINLERAGGPAVEETAKKFSELGKDPLNASVKLNESFNFLTVSTYKQIQAAMELGDKEKAAQIAQDALAEASNTAAKHLQENAGYIVKAWTAVKDTFNSALNALMRFGAEAKNSEISKLQEKAELGEITTAEWDRLQALKAQAKAQDDRTKKAAEENKQVQAMHEWQKKYGGELDSSSSKLLKYMPENERRLKLEQAIAKVKQEGAEAGAKQWEIDAAVAEEKEKYKKITEPKKEKQEASKMPQYESELAQQKAKNEQLGEAEHVFELNFWKKKLDAAKIGSKDYLEIKKKMGDLTTQIAKDEYEKQMEAMKGEEKAAGKNAEKKVDIVRREMEATVKIYGEKSKQAIAAQNSLAEAQLAADEQRKKIKEIAAQKKDAVELAEVDAEQQAAQLRVSLGLMTQAQLLAQETNFENKKYAIKKAALEREKKEINEDKDPVAFAQANAKIEALETQHQTAISQIRNKSILESNKILIDFSNGVGNVFSGTFSKIGTQIKSVGDLAKSLFNGVLQLGLQTGEQLLGKWIANQIEMQVVGKTTATEEAASAAGLAGANAVASMALAPYPLNLTAPEFGAAMMSTAAGFGAIASAAGGYDIPAGVNPLTQLHEQEMVLPRHIAAPLRDAIKTGGLSRMAPPSMAGGYAAQAQAAQQMQQAQTAPAMPPIHLHAHALSGDDAARALSKHQATLLKIVKTATANRRTS